MRVREQLRTWESAMAYTLRQAAAATGRHRSSLLRCIQDGKLSATRDPVSGSWLIEPAELHRLFAPIAGTGDGAEHRSVLDHEHNSTHSTVQAARNTAEYKAVRGAAALAEIRELRARIADKDAQLADAREQINDLRRRLDRADERLTALLTDQRPAPAVAAPVPAPSRRWWPWRR
jgi:Tfp pilus assembly protein FimV